MSKSNECTIIISADTEGINMTSYPQVAIEECSVAEYVCVIDSAFPKAPVVLWYIGDSPVDIKYGYYIDNNVTTTANNGKKTISTLQLTAQREMNNKRVKCVLKNDQTKSDGCILRVTCKYLLVYDYQMTN